MQMKTDLQIPQFLLAAPSSGSGKTTLCRGLMAALSRKGYRVQPYKCGPDYIDTKFHTAVCGRPSINLDTFMATPGHVRALYARHTQGADACVVEGMMGLFDGYDRDRGSSAEIAGLLSLPTVLVVDARSTAYSMAALLYGFTRFRPEVEVVGVIFNRVGSPRHRQMLLQVCTDLDIRCLGCLPKADELAQESRYLGLDFSLPQEALLARLAELIDAHIDLDLLLEQTMRPLPPSVDTPATEPSHAPLAISVARNEESFCFLYEEHLEILRRMGSVSFFDPERDEALPPGTELLYLPGGYPEKHLDALAGNVSMLASVRVYARSGGRVLAECGGMIYLSRGVAHEHGFAPLCDVLPVTIGREKPHRRLSLGYRSFEWGGRTLRGHEFHYTQIVPDASVPPSAATLYDARGGRVDTPVFRQQNVLASYTHLYWGETDVLALFT